MFLSQASSVLSDFSQLFWGMRRIPEDNGKKTEFASEKGKVWFQRSFGASVIHVLSSMKTVFTWFFIASPRKVLWVTTMT